MNNIIGLGVISIYIVAVLLLGRLFMKKGEEVSRKFAHIALSNIWFFVMLFFDSLVLVCILPALFVIFNIISYKFTLFKTIEREKQDGFGTVYYAISLLLICIFTFTIKKPIIGLPAVLIMGYGDGFAAIIGQKIKSKEYKFGNSKKSLAGSITMLVISLFISLLILKIMNVNYFVIKAVGISVIATILEAISIKGLDNITVPIVVTILTYFC